MMKRVLMVLILLLSSMPVLAMPPDCSCPYCFANENDLCTSHPGSVVISCSRFWKSCISGLASQPAAPGREQFLAELGSPAAPADVPMSTVQSCR